MRYHFTVERFLGWLALAATLLGSCQRASYSWQHPPSTPIRAEARIAADSVVAANALGGFAVPAAAKREVAPVAPARRPGGIRRWGRPAASRPAAASALLPPKLLPPTSANRRAPKPGHSLRLQPAQKPYHKGVAVALALLLGFLGAHQFYLGHNRAALDYLLLTVVGAALALLALPVGIAISGVGGLIVALYVLLAGLACIGWAYLHALFDAVRILTGDLTT